MPPTSPPKRGEELISDAIQAIREKDHHLGYIAVKYSMNDWSRLQGIMEESANI